MPPKSTGNKGKSKAKRGRKPAQKVVPNRPNDNPDDEDEEDEAEYLLKFELIELVQGYPEIYDIACPGHKKEYLRNRAWDQIAEALFLDGKRHL